MRVFSKNGILLLIIFACNSNGQKDVQGIIRNNQLETVELVKIWTKEIGAKLTELSENMTRQEKVKESFRDLRNHLSTVDGVVLAEDIASDIRSFMSSKVTAVRRISEYAEFLSFYRKEDEAYKNETRDKYFYFDSDGIEHTEENITRTLDIDNDVFLMECHWWCSQQNLSGLPENIFTPERLKDLFEKRRTDEIAEHSCDCDYPMDVLRKNDTYSNLPMNKDLSFQEKVNFNVSVVKVATNIYERDMAVLEGIRWSEPLDLVFKKNYIEDKDLLWQYFASPIGFMRHYPESTERENVLTILAVKWSEERYYQTYDFRTRSWFTEAMTSPKDIIILLDRSGSMKGKKRKLSHQIVNDILDTLNDNDFVNIYTFNNVSLPLVDCFNDTLFQANEENLRLLREYLPVYGIRYAADISVGLKKAFEILAHFRETNRSANCNQAIMLITEGIDYWYDVSIFNRSNWDKDFPVRIFTYMLSTETEDAYHMEFIACSNMGYYVNMTKMPDIREKILHYLKVMSRPINFCYNDKQTAIWSYLYVDLADRRLSNWLWTKFEGIRQREVFLDHVKRRTERLQQSYSSLSHMLLQEHHEYEKYEEKENYRYMTTVSLPVYGRRKDEYELIGVAGVDVPIKLFKAKIPYDKIGVNGYAFIITNNGYILMHPEHRTEFEYILKPTFNRVDIVETEILDDNNKPRIFGDDIVKLREKMLKREGNKATLRTKYTLDDMKRIVRATRHYYYTEIGPFTLCVVLPDIYGHIKVNKTPEASKMPNPTPDFILNHANWAVHPDWIYCRNCRGSKQTPLEKLEYAYYHPIYRTPLYNELIYDLNKTAWYEDHIPGEISMATSNYVHKIFLSTGSGLTRWKIYDTDTFQNVYGEAEAANDRSIDEDWYQRSVEENFKNEDMFIYSVPFEISGYENNTMIRGTKAIFVEKNKIKTPVAVVGIEFNHQAMYKLYKSITTKLRGHKGGEQITCESHYLDCFILDNNAYVILSDEIEYTGRFIGDIRPDIMHYLVKEEVFEPTRMFDYQATCQFEPPEAPDPENMKCKSNSSLRKMSLFEMILMKITQVLKWMVELWLFPLGGVDSANIIKEESKIFEKLQVKKTVPTPCDREMWLFTLKDGFRQTFFIDDKTKFMCNWPYVVRKIPKTNLIFLAISGHCSMTTSYSYSNSPEPTRISYYSKDVEVSLPCYIATMNNYAREPYMKCYKRDKREDVLNKKSKSYCGHTWK